MADISIPIQQNDGFRSEDSLDPFVIQAPVIPFSMLGREVKEIFEKQAEVEGVVVMKEDVPTGIIMRTPFFQKLGSLYGNSLFLERPIEILVDTAVLTVDVKDSASSLGIRAMKRPQSKLYDFVIVLSDQEYIGVISIRLFLIQLSNRNEAQIQVLEVQQQQLLAAHEQELSLRNSLIKTSDTVKNLLDHAGQGFLLFGSDFIIKDELSLECKRIFKKDIRAKHFIELLGPYLGDDTKSVYDAALHSYFANRSQITDNVYLQLLPSEGIIEGRSIHLEYKRIETNGEKAVMAVLNDITAQKEMEKAVLEEQNTQRLIVKVLTYQGQVKQMVDEFHELFLRGYTTFFDNQPDFQAGLNELLRAVHTFKGDFAQYGFLSASRQLHEFEDALQRLVSDEFTGYNDVHSLMSDFNSHKILKDDLMIITGILGEAFFKQADNVIIPLTRLNALEHEILSGTDTITRESFMHMLSLLKCQNIKAHLQQYTDYLEYLSQRLLKPMPLYLVEGSDIFIDPQKYRGVLRSLVHIYRNMMDHGLESLEERLSLGKPEQGVILCRIEETSQDRFVLRISDDGRGIDPEKLREKARTSGRVDDDVLAQMTDQQLIELIFLDQFSTKEKADSLSGRGVGMASVRNECRQIGGDITVESQLGKGTTYIINLPS